MILLIFKIYVLLQKVCISYGSNGSKNDSRHSIDENPDVLHAVECRECRKDRGPENKGPDSGSIVCKVMPILDEKVNPMDYFEDYKEKYGNPRDIDGVLEPIRCLGT